jgi:hypothetical protein
VPSELASTLVHEVVHVLNRSECRYYKDVSAHRLDDNAAFVEEFRSFFAECIFVSAEMELPRCSAQALEATTSYGFHHSLDVELSPLIGQVDYAVVAASCAFNSNWIGLS